MLWLSYHCTMAYFYWTHNFNRNCHILHKIAIVRILIYVGWRAECYKFFFLFFCMSLGNVEKQWQVTIQECPRPPTAPNVDPKLVFRHGVMDRPWLQRKRTDTLTTYSNCFVVVFFNSFFLFFLGCVFFLFVFLFVFYKPTPPHPKQNILLP